MSPSLFDLDPAVGRLEAIEQLHERTALYTAEPIVDELLGRIGWPGPGKRLLDPGASDGAFLLRALARLDLSDREAVLNVQGWEIHPIAVRHARDRVHALLIKAGWPFDGTPPVKRAAYASFLICSAFQLHGSSSSSL